MCRGVMKTAETVYARWSNKRLVKILDSNYLKADLQQVADNATHMAAEDRTQLLSILKFFEYLFGGTLEYWDTYPVDLIQIHYKVS